MIFYRYLISVVLFFNFTFACTLCKLETPVVLVEVNSYSEDGSRYLDVKWEFEKEFTAQTLLAYDINGDSVPQKDELAEVKLSLEDYLKQNRFLTHITTIDKNEQKKYLDFDVVRAKIDYQYYKLIYEYRVKTDIDLENINSLELKFFDEKEFFDFVFKKFRFKEYKGVKTKREKTTIIKYFSNLENIKIQEPKTKVEDQSKTIMDMLKEAMATLKEDITNLLTDIKDNNTFSSYVWLLVFSFLYGVVHALGPGHGKSLVASYFLSKDRSVMKAFNISLMIGVVHTFSAFLLTFTIYFILKSVLSEYFNDVEAVAIKASAVVIIGIAIYLIAQKFKKPKIKSFNVGAQQSFVKIPSNQHIDTSACGCNSCKTTSTDIGVILAAGIIPCPGTITIFVFTFGLGIYLVGFLSAVWMSIGMSFIIFLAAYLSIKVKTKTNSNPIIKKVLEYGSLVFILALGLMLLLF